MFKINNGENLKKKIGVEVVVPAKMGQIL